MSAPERRPVFDSHLVPGDYGAAGEAGVLLREWLADAVEVSALRRQPEAVIEGARAALGVDLPPMGSWSRQDELIALGLAPNLWRLIGPAGAPGDFAGRIASLLGDAAHVVETGHGLGLIEASGPGVRHALAKGCRLDLYPAVFRTGHAARTIIAEMPVTIWRLADRGERADVPAFALAVPRSFAQSFVHFLLAAAAETGCRVLPLSRDLI